MASFHEGARIAITGRAVLTPLADSPDALHAALSEGRSAITASEAAGGVGVTEIKDFDHTKYATIRGMRMYNKPTRMAICAAKLALGDAKLEPGTTYAGDDLGLLMASTYGHMDVLFEYDRSLVQNGIQRTNGALMPFVIPSAPGAMIGLSFGLKAFSMTFSDGGAGGLDTLGVGARWLGDGRAKACVVVASFATFPDLVLAAARSGMLGPADQLRAFDRRSGGTAIGEAAVAFVLERAEDAEARGAAVHGLVRGYGTAFGAPGGSLASPIRRAAVDALKGAGAKADDVALASAGGAGIADVDRAEVDALAAVLAGHRSRVPVTAHKGALGDTIDASGALQALVALSSLEKQTAPPVARLGEPDASLQSLDFLRQSAPVGAGLALVTSVSRAGACSALVLSKGNA